LDDPAGVDDEKSPELTESLGWELAKKRVGAELSFLVTTVVSSIKFFGESSDAAAVGSSVTTRSTTPSATNDLVVAVFFLFVLDRAKRSFREERGARKAFLRLTRKLDRATK
jgi:hypothetical protein